MANYGNLFIALYDQDLTLLNPGDDAIYGIKATGKEFLSRVGNGRFTAYIEPGADPTLYARGLQAGNIAVAYIYDAIKPGNLRVCTFKMNDLFIRTMANGASIVEATGPDMLDELRGYSHNVDIGYPWTAATLGPEAAGSPKVTLVSIGTVWTRLAQSAHPGEGQNEFSLKVVDNTGFNVGDPLCLQLNDGDHTSVIYEVGNDGTYDFLKIEDLVPSEASGAKIVTVPQIFAGSSIIIPLNSGSHYTRIKDDPGINKIYLEDPIPTGKSVAKGASVKVLSNQTEVTTDIQDIMRPATDDNWVLNATAAGTPGSGTASGTAWQVDNATVISLLIDAAEASGEFFRIDHSTSEDVPRRRVEWRASADSAGPITLVMPEQADAITRYTDPANYAVMQSINRETRWQVVTEIVPIGGGDYPFTLGDATEHDEGALAAHPGFSQWFTRGQWVITNDDVALADYKFREAVTFSHIKSKSKASKSKTEAADRLQTAAVNYLSKNNRAKRFYTIECVLHKVVKVGQSVIFTYTEDAPNWTESGVTLYITEITHDSTPEVPRLTTLMLSDEDPVVRETGATLLARGNTVSGSSIGGGGGSGGGSGGGTGTYRAGDNISITPDGIISLSENVVIGSTLNLPGGTQFRLWDDTNSRYLDIRVVRKSGVPYLVFVDTAGNTALSDVLAPSLSGLDLLGIT